MSLDQTIICREIDDADHDAVVALLANGFRAKSINYWIHALNVLSSRESPVGYPRYGHVITADDKVVGVILQIFSVSSNNIVRCNLSSWYVDPEFRMYASVLARKATANKSVVYTNISSAPHTRRGIAAQGFVRFSDGVMLTTGILNPALNGATVIEISKNALKNTKLLELLTDHASTGCTSIVCNVDGEMYPFIFLIRKIPHTFISVAQLIYCDDMSHFIRLSGNLSRFFIRRGVLGFLIDANGPIKGLHGIYFADKYPKYFCGTDKPRLGDLTYTEFALFGC